MDNISQHRFDKVVEKANDAFWKTVADEFSEATSGDVNVGIAINLRDQMREAVASWVDENVPNGVKVTEVLLHDIEYHYKAGDWDMTDCDREHVAYCISQGFREGELASSCVEGSAETHYGWWSIKK